jgi:hypothetical protein
MAALGSFPPTQAGPPCGRMRCCASGVRSACPLEVWLRRHVRRRAPLGEPLRPTLAVARGDRWA